MECQQMWCTLYPGHWWLALSFLPFCHEIGLSKTGTAWMFISVHWKHTSTLKTRGKCWPVSSYSMEQWRTDLLSLPSVLSITLSLTSPAGGILLENVAVDKMFFLPCHVPGLPIWWLFWDSVVKTVFLQICLEKWRDPILLSSWENPGALTRATEEKGYCFGQTGVSKPGVQRMFSP